MMEGKIYDITGGCRPPVPGSPGCSRALSPCLSAEWAGCQRVGIAPDTHRVPYHISCGARAAARHRSVRGGRGNGRCWLSQPPNPLVPLRCGPPAAADLQDFFTRVLRGGAGPAAGGGAFPPPPPAPPGPPPRAEGAGPKGEAKPKRRKRARRPLRR